jgi:GntR family transcriptional repressor for pyruvate dehydrogenase complex
MNVRKTYEMVADSIRENIEQGTWPPGTKLPSVEKLAQRYRVGRSSIREALMTLQAAGLVQVRHGGGTFVRQPEEVSRTPPLVTDAGRLGQWLEFRRILETESARLAALRRTSAQMEQIRAVLAEMAQEQDEAALELADRRFHLLIARSSGNSWIHHALENVFASMGGAMRESRRLWLFGEQAEAARLLEEHLSILERIEAGDADGAAETMEGHLVKVARALQRLFQGS